MRLRMRNMKQQRLSLSDHDSSARQAFEIEPCKSLQERKEQVMKRNTVIERWSLSILVVVGMSGASSAFATHEPLRDEQVRGLSEGTFREEELLNFKIKEMKSSSNCVANKLRSDQKLLDPHLPDLGRTQSPTTSATDDCIENESRLPMSQ